MVLTREENEMLTRVGPGTPGGELLRRYWHPVAPAGELTDDNPTRFVRLLGEDLVLWKDKGGHVGLIQDHCPHRGASLLYGRVEERGIACAYHGWLYDVEGNCQETPAEPADSKLYLTVKARAYPVKKHIGLYWAYLGPLPAPEIPHYDVWTRQDGVRKISVHPQLDSNWMQAMENSADPAHLQILHQDSTGRGKPPSSTRGWTDDVASFSFYENDVGLIKHREYRNGHTDEHPLVFPNILRQADATQIRVPIDDTHTYIVFVTFRSWDLAGNGHSGSNGQPVSLEDEDPEVRYVEPYKNPVGVLHPNTRFDMTQVLAQDHMAWETQGPIADRTSERLASSDRGVVMYREMLKREIERVQQGLDPKCTWRDPNHPMIDTNLELSLSEIRERRDTATGRVEARAGR